MIPSRDDFRYRPYGAIELKMTYQRNMLIANILVILAIAATYVSVSILAGNPDIVIIPPRVLPDDIDSVRVVIDPLQVVNVVSDGVGARPALPRDERVGIPTPVPDTMVVDDRVIATGRGVGLDSTGTGTSDTGDFGLTPLHGASIGDDLPEYGVWQKVEKEPAMVVEVKPEYPSLAKRLGLEGKATIGALVLASGKVGEAHIVSSSGCEALDSAAVTAAYLNVYSPGIQNGLAIPVWVTYSVEFRMGE